MEQNITKVSQTAKERQLDNVIDYCEQAIETHQFNVVSLSELKIPEHYCRENRFEAEEILFKSIMKRGQILPLIVNCNPERRNVIIDGVGRHEILQGIGCATANVIYIDIPEAEEKRVSEELNLRFRVTPKSFLKENGLYEFMFELMNELDKNEGEKAETLSDSKSNKKEMEEDIEAFRYCTNTARKKFLQELKGEWRKSNLSQVMDTVLDKFKEQYENTEI